MAKPGRKTRYKKEFDQLAYNYCLMGAIDKQLASFFETTEQTINAWKKAHPSFLESIKKGKQTADAQVAQALFHRATGYEHPEQKVFCQEGKVITHDMVKHYAPDPTAMIFWLKNRQPKLWRDKQELEVSERPTVKLTKKRFDGVSDE